MKSTLLLNVVLEVCVVWPYLYAEFSEYFWKIYFEENYELCFNCLLSKSFSYFLTY